MIEGIEIRYADTIEKAVGARDAGFEPVECAFGNRSIVGLRRLDHHGIYANEPAVSVKAVRRALNNDFEDRFVVTGRADCDQCYAIAVLSRKVSPVLEEAEAIAELDIDPIGRDRTADRYVQQLMIEQAIGGKPRCLETSEFAVRKLISVFNGFFSLEDVDRAIGIEQGRIRVAGKSIKEVGSRGVAFAVSRTRSFDAWYMRAPVVVHYDPSAQTITFGLCPKKGGILTDRTGLKILGEQGLTPLYEGIDRVLGVSGSGGRDVVGGAPRGVTFSEADARRAYDFLVTCARG